MRRSAISLQEKMSSCCLVTSLFTLLSFGWVFLETEIDEVQRVCAGSEFRLPVYSASATVTFQPKPEGSRRIILEEGTVQDPRFEWIRNETLVLKEVTSRDQGLYAFKMSSWLPPKTVHLTVTECTKSYHRYYGDNFVLNVSLNGSILEFSPWGAPPEAMPIVLWNRADPKTIDGGHGGRGRLRRGGKVWVAERVTQEDQGSYTLRDTHRNLLSRSTLTVLEHSFNVTGFIKESLHLPLFLPVPHAHLFFTPAQHPGEPILDPVDSKLSQTPVQLISDGQIANRDLRYRGLISLGKNGTINEVIIASLTSNHEGVYEIRDRRGHLVSSTILRVTERGFTWKKLMKAITAPSGVFLSLTGIILCIKRYPKCSLTGCLSRHRGNRTPSVNPPEVNIQGYSQPSSEPPDYNSLQQAGRPGRWSPRARPTHTGGTPVTIGCQRTENQRLAPGGSLSLYNPTSENTHEEEKNISFSVPGGTDCLHFSEECVQFQPKKDGNEGKSNNSHENFFTLPLEKENSESCTVYNSDKLNYL
ncbi:uncharacterized protein LOC115049977 isoform X2 [Echeneis naucrates]|uniref:uncharacterized protein LOC115049977 isoform X2 n=1 Tax=Echeneis naucrates TaxID=173247 RepID=UPI001113B75C|nr:uncharacterized protein LOC115049977 isoform X2 [Echeneis naucrates]